MRRLRVTLPVMTVAAGLWAQTANKPLTNAEIESMVVAGVPESTIVMKIQAAVFGGFAALDASSSAVIALKQKGASEAVLDAVVWAEPFSKNETATGAGSCGAGPSQLGWHLLQGTFGVGEAALVPVVAWVLL